MTYKFPELPQVNEYFRSCFGIGFKPFYDKLLSPIVCKLQIDIIEFDNWIKKEHGDYEKEGKSLSEIIFEKYGDEAAALIDELI